MIDIQKVIHVSCLQLVSLVISIRCESDTTVTTVFVVSIPITSKSFLPPSYLLFYYFLATRTLNGRSPLLANV